MRPRISFLICALSFATCAFAKDVYLSIGGSVGAFRTDLRIFNPSSTKDIQVQAYLLATNNTDNSSVQPKTITLPKRQMLVYDDVVSSLFSGSGLAGIRLKSDDDFIATQRVYALAADGSTNGQFVPGLDVSTAQKKGVIIQLKATGAQGQARTFRTNIGAVNPNPVAANVTWRLYDKNNALVGQPMTQTMQAFAVVQPLAMTSFATSVAANTDFTDAWVSYESDQPLFAYGSVIDNLNDAGTFIPMAADSGVASAPQQPTAKTFNVTEQNFSITISPAIGPNDLTPGDTVTFHITVRDSNHGLQLSDPDNRVLISPVIFSPGDVIDKTFTITKNGTYRYFCTNSLCGSGHNSMTGTFVVGTETPTEPRY
jgi:heme/copper-type cytochrome/quinol oxidase subunit 2